MSEKLNQLKEILGEVVDLHAVADLLEWDQQTYMPPGGSEARGHQIATIEKLEQIKFTSDEVGGLIEDVTAEMGGVESLAASDSDDAALVRVTARNFEKARRVPAEFVSRKALITAAAFEAWGEAKRTSDFSLFRPQLEKVLGLVKEYITFFPRSEHPYDVLLNDFDPGMKTSEVRAIFNTLRSKQVELVRAIASKKQVDGSPLYGKYNEQKMEKFAREVAGKFGYDWANGRLDRALHPFETTFSIKDVRITTRFEKKNPTLMLFSTMHETGHALYEMGVHPAYERTPLMHGAYSSVHESQSRLWENLVGRSLPFWEHFYPQFKKLFPAQLDGVGLKKFYKSINRVEPSLIRVISDEATYNMHIMLRLELEIGMLEGSVQVKDLPGMWNEKMKEYLGITPKNDADGVLQDVHWAAGLLGYFPTYALGNLISAQIWEKVNADLPELGDEIARGQFGTLLEWLRENLHKHGRKYAARELVRKVTGANIQADAYIQYLTGKYSEIYGL